MLSDRLRKVFEQSGFATQAEFAADAGIALERVKNLLSGRTQALKHDEGKALERKYGWRELWLRTGKGPERLTKDEQAIHSGANAPGPALAEATRLLSLHQVSDPVTIQFVQAALIASARRDDAALHAAFADWLQQDAHHPVRPDTTRLHTAESGGVADAWHERQTATREAVRALPSTGAKHLINVVDGKTWEYQVVQHITEPVCAGRAASTQPGTPAAPAHTPAGPMAFERHYMSQALGRADDSFLSLTVEGDSMAPALLHGELAVIDTQVTRVNVSGVYVLRFDGDLTIKRITKRSDGSLVISSDNPQYARGDEQFTREQAATLQVIGRMVWPRVR